MENTGDTRSSRDTEDDPSSGLQHGTPPDNWIGFSEDEISILKNDPDFQEYYKTVNDILSGEIPDAQKEPVFRRRDIEVTRAMFGDNLLVFRNRVWLFSDSNTAYMCDRCLWEYPDPVSFRRHVEGCDVQCPPGRCMYMDKAEGTSVFEVDEGEDRVFCQRLCIIGKAFIQRKTLYLDVDSYLFYVMTVDGKISGFFSREKGSREHNLSCILVLPPYQSRGYGSMLIDMSYVLGHGGPERPLSEDGQAVYRRYWKNRLQEILQGLGGERISIHALSKESGFSVDDVVYGLELMGIDPEDPVYDISGCPPVSFKRCKRHCLVGWN